MKDSQRKAMFSRMSQLKNQQSQLLKNTSNKQIYDFDKNFANKEREIMKEANRISNISLKQMNMDDSLKTATMNYEMRKQLTQRLKQARISPISRKYLNQYVGAY